MTVNSSFRWSGLPLALLVLIQSFLSVPMYALSGGPTQPEFGQPATVGADNMVDLFTGNFQYSIPLFEIGGYPMTLSYSSDHKMEEEASWVGFGWTLNPGVISRQVRGLPDDFKGDKIVRRGNMKDNVTTGVSPGADVEFFGRFGLKAALNFTYNNYTGFNFSTDYSPSVNIMNIIAGGSQTNSASNEQPTSDETGFKFPLKVVLPDQLTSANHFNLSLSSNVNSRAGLEYVAWSANMNSFSRSDSWRNGGVTYTPTADLPRTTVAESYNFKVGGKGWFPDGIHLTLRGQKVIQGLATKSISQPTYGTLYLENAATDNSSVMDYNKEQGGILNQDATRLPIPYGTPDVFSVTGAGMSGQLEIARTDFQAFRPAAVISSSVSRGRGTDVAPGNIVHFGVNVDASRTSSTKGGWNDGTNRLFAQVVNEGTQSIQPKAYLRFASEQSVQTTDSHYKLLGGADPIRPDISRAQERYGLQIDDLDRNRDEGTGLSERLGQNATIPTTDARNKNATVANYLTFRELQFAGLNRKMERFSVFDTKTKNFDFKNLKTTDISSGYAHFVEGKKPADHHIGQIDITSSAGQRFVYGLPVYNVNKREVTFNAADLGGGLGDQGSRDYGTINYKNAAHPEIVSINNTSGNDHYYDEIITDPYPVAHLLTGVLSPEYMDQTGDGPTVDDLGNYVKIGYSPLTNASGNEVAVAGYRTPLGENTAVLNEGNLSDLTDDKASFTAGSKEIYYVHHMDSKTHRAVFITSTRHDAIPVDEDGKLSGLRLRKLDEIKIFTLAELELNPNDPKPIKTVHFNYVDNGDLDTEISANVLNAECNDGTINPACTSRRGKLTLQSVSFTYGNNLRGKENPYTFSYKTHIGGQKVAYQPFMIDRWGTQRPSSPVSALSPMYYPFAIQKEEVADEYNSLGNLEQITLPSGAKISIEYESDDYAYVQDYRAGRMFKLVGFSKEYNPDFTAGVENVDVQSTKLYEEKFSVGIPNLYTYIELDESITPWDPDNNGNWKPEEARRRLLEGVDQLYFSSLVSLKPDTRAERITGYAGFDDSFLQVITRENAPDYLVLKLKGLNIENRETQRRAAVHPISYAAIEKMRAQLPQFVYDVKGDKLDVFTMAAILKQNARVFQNFYSWRLSKPNQNAQTFVPNASFVRLAEPLYEKFGGGSRVSAITLDDNWLKPKENNAMTESQPEDASVEYRKTYTYTTTEPVSGQTISSGVAANEPMNGKEEMLFINVGKQFHPKFLAPDRTYYLENPAGLHFYPGPSVGYSEVSMQIEFGDDLPRQSKPGRTTHEFYTARDYPVKVSMTNQDREPIEPSARQLPFLSRYLNRLGLAQGFTIEVNDMHGKPKSTVEYGHDDKPISSTKYKYRHEGEEGSGKRSLDNFVDLVDVTPGGEGTSTMVQAKRDLLGVNMDVWVEHTLDQTETDGGGVQANLDVGAAGPFPLIATIPWPNLTKAETSLQTATITKLISRKGILEEVEVMNNGSTLSTKNLRFDGLTGTPVLTSTENEYDRPIFQQTSLAYWMDTNQGMGPAFQNSGWRAGNVDIDSKGYLSSDDAWRVYKGDEFVVYDPDKSFIASNIHRVIAVPDDQEEMLILIDSEGKPINLPVLDEGYNIVRVRSGYRNLLTAITAQVSALDPPTNDLFYGPASQNILSSSAVTYDDSWGNLCEPIAAKKDPVDPEDPIGPGNCTTPVKTKFPVIAVVDTLDKCSVVPLDWRPKLPQMKKECGACDSLFNTYARAGFMPNLGRYATCDKTSAGIVTYTIRENWKERISQCEFAELGYDNYGLFAGNIVSLETIAESQGDASCNKLDRPEELTFCKGLQQPGFRTFARSSQLAVGQMFNSKIVLTSNEEKNKSCFPWHSDSGINPYLDGRRGNWRVKASYVLNQRDRKQSAVAGEQANTDPKALGNTITQPLLFQDGVLESYQPFWFERDNTQQSSSYIATTEVTRYDEHGHEQETEDALGIPSGVQYGFLQNLPLAVAQNARHLDIGFDSFEDYIYERGDAEEPLWKRHFGVLGRETQVDDASVTSAQSHTGKFSYAIPSGQTGALSTYPTLQCDGEQLHCPDDQGCSSCVNGFTPTPGKTYLVSAWIASDESIAFGGRPINLARYSKDALSQVNAPHLLIRTSTGSSTEVQPAVYASGPVVEGWQQLQFSFEVPSDAESVALQFNAPSSSSAQTYYFDDVRIRPYESEMTTYVYDYVTLRLMAQMDDRGYAVLYEYNDEGMLIRQKRETERGVMTITEQHNNLAPASPQKP